MAGPDFPKSAQSRHGRPPLFAAVTAPPADGPKSAARPARDAGQGHPQSKFQRQDGDIDIQGFNLQR